MAPRVGADPDVRPGRWDRDRGDPAELASIADQLAIGPVVREPLPGAATANTGAIVRHVPQSGSLGGRHCIERVVGDEGGGHGFGRRPARFATSRVRRGPDSRSASRGGVGPPAWARRPSSSSASVAVASMRGLPAELGACALGRHDRHPQREVEPARRGRLQTERMACRHGRSHQAPWQLDGRRAEDLAELLRSEGRLGGDVEGACDVGEHRSAIGIGHVAGVHALEHQAARQREPTYDRGPHQAGGQERAGEEPAATIRAGRPEDERGSQAHHARTAVSCLEGVQVAFHLRLVLCVEGRCDAIARPALVHRLLRARRVHADRGRDDEAFGSDRSRGLHDAPAAEDVRPPEVVHVVRGLDAPGQVHDGRAASRRPARARRR